MSERLEAARRKFEEDSGRIRTAGRQELGTLVPGERAVRRGPLGLPSWALPVLGLLAGVGVAVGRARGGPARRVRRRSAS